MIQLFTETSKNVFYSRESLLSPELPVLVVPRSGHCQSAPRRSRVLPGVVYKAEAWHGHCCLS